MSHVDEGTLHAYLDGELPSGERAALESHLAQCATCRSQLAEERTLLERATALLGSARPVERAVPPFEQLRRAPSSRRHWYVRTGVAWAASVVLALGLGYYIAEERGVTPGVDANSQPVAAARSESLQAGDALGSVQRQESAPSRKPVARRRASAPPPQVEEDVSGYAAQPPVVSLRGAAPLPLDTVRRLHDSAAALEAVVVTDKAVATAAPSTRVESRAVAAPSVRNLVSTTWPLISRGKAASLLGDRPVGVPGLVTRGIHGSPTGDGTVVVEQSLDSKTVIQIFQRPASSAEVDELGARERADRALARYVGRLRVEISGPVSTDSLNKLLEQVEPLP